MRKRLALLAWRRPLAGLFFVMGWLLVLAPLALADEGFVHPSFPLDVPYPAPLEQAPANNRECSACHINIVPSWRQSSHASAYSDETFQRYWQAQDNDPQCLSCHTTNFLPRTGAFTHAGVSCSACHGATPTTHPPSPVTMPEVGAMCGDCHTSTYQEWSSSAHGTPEIQCSTCHDPHTQQLVASENELCMTCHESAPETYSHISHPEQTCADCHWHKAEVSEAHFISGNLLPSGHDGRVKTQTCNTCHAEADAEWQQFISTGGTNSLALRELETQLAQVEDTSTQAATDSGRIVQFGLGLNLGAFLILSVLFVFWRRSRQH